MEERIQKILARAGLGSRRACEEYIAAGRVRVNGQVAVLGDKADSQRDRIQLDGKPVQVAEPLVYIALYKPRGVLSAVTSLDPRPTVLDLVDVPERVYPVGRLDADSEGLILLTNDGDLANRLTHPRYGHEKEYRVLVARRPDEEQLATWRRGVVLEDGFHTSPADVKVDAPAGKGAWLRVVMREGRKRQIRETGTQIGLPVVRILRVRIGTLQLGNLKPREWRHLTPEEAAGLKGGRARGDSKRGKGAAIPKKARSKPPTRSRSKNNGESSRPRRSSNASKRRN
jgi:23S rRNA pseudouridine2605 synthase